MSSSGSTLRLLLHDRKQDHVPDRWLVRQQHHQPVDPYAKATARRQAVLDGAKKILIHRVRLDIARGALGRLPLEARALIDWVRQLRECVRVLTSKDDQLESLHEPRVISPRAGKRRDLDRVVDDERRLSKFCLHVLFEQVVELIADSLLSGVL